MACKAEMGKYSESHMNRKAATKQKENIVYEMSILVFWDVTLHLWMRGS
jgi:hypothetical protein